MPHPNERSRGIQRLSKKVTVARGGQRMREAISLFCAVLALLWPASPCRAGVVLSSSTPLDLGFCQMYNLQFEEAHRTFNRWEQLHPDDPLGPTSDAAAYLFSEFDRLGVLQWELFLDDEKFK